MVQKINTQTIQILMRGQIPVAPPTAHEGAPAAQQQAPVPPVAVREAAPERRADRSQYHEQKVDLNDPNQAAAAQRDTREVKREPVRADKAPGRNEPCPCGSGKKFKNCHGREM